MIKILPSIILIIGLLGCAKTERKQLISTTDSSGVVKVDSVRASKATTSDYEASLLYSHSESDSLLLDQVDLKNLISLFKTNGIKIQEKEYGGADCDGKFIRIIYVGDTLTIDKYSCGDYGFGNSQYLTDDDSLKLVRNYKMEWSGQADKMEFAVTEKIYEFHIDKVTISERTKVINGWQNFSFVNIPFVTTTVVGQNYYMNLNKEQKELLSREILEY